MGFVTLSIFVFTEQGLHGAVLQMIAHGIITGALFLCVGVIYERTHDRTIAKMGGLAGVVPVYAAIFGFFVLASLGLPGLAGFVGEFLVIIGAFAFWPVVAAVTALAMMLGAAYLLWMYQRVIFGDLTDFLKGIGHHLTDINRFEAATLAPLVVLAIGFGVFPGLLTQLWQTPVTEILSRVAPAVRLAAGLP
jgi:NADH-quinone oxidoreductase subunit M